MIKYYLRKKFMMVIHPNFTMAKLDISNIIVFINQLFLSLL